jgi:hypothetical protein
LRLPDALVRALEARDAPPVDVVWCNTSALRAQRGLCESLEGLPVMRSSSIALGRRSSAGWPIAQPMSFTTCWRIVAVYAVPPDSWRVLERAEHTGRIVLYPGGNGFYPVAQVMGGGNCPDSRRHGGVLGDRASHPSAARRAQRSISLPEVIGRGELISAIARCPMSWHFKRTDWTSTGRHPARESPIRPTRCGFRRAWPPTSRVRAGLSATRCLRRCRTAGASSWRPCR